MIALTIFGTPQGADAIIHPQVDLTLPGSLNQAIDAPFKYYPGVEVFRLCRFRHEMNATYLYALQTQCFDMRGPREGAFIGVGIFTTEYEKIDPALLVQGLRELLESAQRAVTFEGRFTKTISEARRQFQIPAAIDQILNIGNGGTPDGATSSLIVREGSRDFFVLAKPPSAQIESLIEMFESAPFLPLDNVYAAVDARVIEDCRSDSITTVFDSISGFLQRHDQIVRAAVAALSHEKKKCEAEVRVLREVAATAANHLQTKIDQVITLERDKFRNEKMSLQREIERLKYERYERPLTTRKHYSHDSEWSWLEVGLATTVFVLFCGMGFAIWNKNVWSYSLVLALSICVLLVGLSVSSEDSSGWSWREWFLTTLLILAMVFGVCTSFANRTPTPPQEKQATAPFMSKTDTPERGNLPQSPQTTSAPAPFKSPSAFH